MAEYRSHTLSSNPILKLLVSLPNKLGCEIIVKLAPWIPQSNNYPRFSRFLRESGNV